MWWLNLDKATFPAANVLIFFPILPAVLICTHYSYKVTLQGEEPHWTLMSLPIGYPPMPSYFRLSIIFLTPQILQRPPRWCDLLRPSHKGSRDHHWLYPIPITPSVWYHIGDLPYDLRTTSLHFPFLVSFLLPDASFCGPTNHRSLHCVIGTLPYISLHPNLVLALLIVCI